MKMMMKKKNYNRIDYLPIKCLYRNSIQEEEEEGPERLAEYYTLLIKMITANLHLGFDYILVVETRMMNSNFDLKEEIDF